MSQLLWITLYFGSFFLLVFPPRAGEQKWSNISSILYDDSRTKKKERHHYAMIAALPNFLFPTHEHASTSEQKWSSISSFSLPFSMTTRGPKKKKDIAMPRSSPTADDKKGAFPPSRGKEEEDENDSRDGGGNHTTTTTRRELKKASEWLAGGGGGEEEMDCYLFSSSLFLFSRRGWVSFFLPPPRSRNKTLELENWVNHAAATNPG